jgi:hypothetical protein
MGLRHLDYLSPQKVKLFLRLAILKLQLCNCVIVGFICLLKLRNPVTKFRHHFWVFIHNVASPFASRNDAIQNAPATNQPALPQSLCSESSNKTPADEARHKAGNVEGERRLASDDQKVFSCKTLGERLA